MNRFARFARFATGVLISTIASSAMMGCASNTYQPQATDTGLAAAAGKATYPYNAQAQLAEHIFATVAPDATITIYNAGDESYVNLVLWVNKTYSLQVPKLDARDKIAIAPATLFNSTGSNMGGAPASSITKVQIFENDKLWDVQGPIVPKS
jgi:hypothetical protein